MPFIGARCISIAGLLLCALHIALAATYFVSEKGSDRASGVSLRTSFQTLQHAADLTVPGDTVFVMNGTYTNATPTAPVLKIVTPGKPASWITYAAYPGHKPLISFNSWTGISFEPTAAYIEVRGFSILGNNYNVTLEGAKLAQKVPDPLYNGNCIFADGRAGTAAQRPHHLRILGNEVRACGSSGIGVNQTDYVTVADNTVYDSSWYSIYGASPISINSSWNSDGFTGYKFFVVRNRIYGNKELIPWKAVGYISDGEAIIVDTNRDKTFQNYAGRTLIANNVIYGNDSSAIQVYLSDHVDIVNNSMFQNVQSTDAKFIERGEVNLTDATDVNVINNVIYSRPDRNPVTIGSKHPCTACFFDYNVYYGGTNNPKIVGGQHDLVVDPLYVNPTASNRSRVDLRLGPGSPAAGSGLTWLYRYIDADYAPRGGIGKWNRGAYVTGHAAPNSKLGR